MNFLINKSVRNSIKQDSIFIVDLSLSLDDPVITNVNLMFLFSLKLIFDKQISTLFLLLTILNYINTKILKIHLYACHLTSAVDLRWPPSGCCARRHNPLRKKISLRRRIFFYSDCTILSAAYTMGTLQQIKILISSHHHRRSLIYSQYVQIRNSTHAIELICRFI